MDHVLSKSSTFQRWSNQAKRRVSRNLGACLYVAGDCHRTSQLELTIRRSVSEPSFFDQ